MPTYERNVDFEPGRRDELDEDGEGLDLDAIRDFASLVFRAPARHPKLAIATFLVVAVLGIVISKAVPRVYNSQTRLLAQSSALLRALSGSVKDGNKEDNPIGNAADTITRYDNLVALVKQADLVNRFYAARPPALRFKDQALSFLTGKSPNRSEEDKLRMIVAVLGKRLAVSTDESTLTLSVDWDDPQTAYDLVLLVQKNFLEARYDNDVAAITESSEVLEEHAKKELDRVDRELEGYQKAVSDVLARNAASRAVKAHPTVVPVARGAAPSAPAAAASPHDSDAALALEDKRRQVRALEDARQHELDAARQELMQAQLTLTPAHPTVKALQQKVDTLSQPSPELFQLREQERALMAQIAPQSASPAASPLPAASTPPAAWAASLLRTPSAPESSAPAAPPIDPGTALNEDANVQLAREKLEDAITAYRSVMSKIDAANVELEITRAAYKRRFTVLTPAEIPLAPKQQTPRLIAVGGVIFGALLALLFAVLADFARGRLIEAWQVRRVLKLELLGEVDVTAPAPTVVEAEGGEAS